MLSDTRKRTVEDIQRLLETRDHCLISFLKALKDGESSEEQLLENVFLLASAQKLQAEQILSEAKKRYSKNDRSEIDFVFACAAFKYVPDIIRASAETINNIIKEKPQFGEKRHTLN